MDRKSIRMLLKKLKNNMKCTLSVDIHAENVRDSFYIFLEQFKFKKYSDVSKIWHRTLRDPHDFDINEYADENIKIFYEKLEKYICKNSLEQEYSSFSIDGVLQIGNYGYLGFKISKNQYDHKMSISHHTF